MADETLALIKTERFRDLVAAHATFHVSAGSDTIAGTVLVEALAGDLSSRAPVPITLSVTDKATPSATPGVTVLSNDKKTALIRIQPYVLQQWRSSSIESRACAVNTLAHEITHTVVDTSASARQLFTDGAMWWARLLNRDLVSYGVGAIAQCLYLESARAWPQWATNDCIKILGMRNYAGCEHPAPEPALTCDGM